MDSLERLADHVGVELRSPIAIVTLDRPAKRNALDGGTVHALGAFFAHPPAGVRAAVLASSGEHFSSGLDLAELTETSVFDGVVHSSGWRRPFDSIELGTVPVVSVLRGAVIGGGLELALATHIRVAEPSAYYALPEGSRGIFVGAGASVRLPRMIGVHRMTDMMLTGRVLDARSGHDLGISQYLVDEGDGLTTAIDLASRIAENSPIANWAVLQALPRIAEMAPADGLFVESLVAAITQGSDEAKSLLGEFLAGRASKAGASAGAARGGRDGR